MKKKRIKLITMILSAMLTVPLVSFDSISSNAVSSNGNERFVPEVKEEDKDAYLNILVTRYEMAQEFVKDHKENQTYFS